MYLGSLRRCFQCRSRGELGSCKDPFKFNVTQLAKEPGIEAIPCASGWCGKVIERQGTLRTDGEQYFVFFEDINCFQQKINHFFSIE